MKISPVSKQKKTRSHHTLKRFRKMRVNLKADFCSTHNLTDGPNVHPLILLMASKKKHAVPFLKLTASLPPCGVNMSLGELSKRKALFQRMQQSRVTWHLFLGMRLHHNEIKKTLRTNPVPITTHAIKKT